ncbi:MAG: hypothetical protein UW58_C0035G0010 [Candidatus Collierbacteria bacterium GW2011_GWC2_44_30]|nr:MAG: hypothetical protein UW58_C0035G0010 [Candidatus Collierbacteria bacterium GW2011_GWC2_44_30]
MADFDKLVVSFLVDEVVGGFFISVPPGHVACVYDRGAGVLKRVLPNYSMPRFWNIPLDTDLICLSKRPLGMNR